MGGFFGGLAGLGNVGEQFAQGREIERQRKMSEEEFKQKREHFQSWVDQTRSQMELTKQRQVLEQQRFDLQSKGYKVGTQIFKDENGFYLLAVNPQGEAKHIYATGAPVAKPSSDKPTKAFGPPGGGEPTGLIRDGKAIMPGMQEWTPDDQKFLDAEISSYRKKQQARPLSIFSQMQKEHPNWTVEQIAQAIQRPSFPRIQVVNDAEGNTLGYNFLQGTLGGGVGMKFIPAGAGGAPTAGGVIPPRPTSTTLTMSQMAHTVLPMINSLNQEVRDVSQSLGPLAGRWNEVMVGTVGADNPQVASLQMDLKLFASALVRTHFGARGGQEYIEGLENYLRLAQSPENLISRINASEQWLMSYAAMTGHGTQTSTGKKSGGFAVKAPNGKTYTFPDQKSADAFKQSAGIP